MKIPEYPSDLGLNPSRHPAWREYQKPSIEWVTGTDGKKGLNAPTGNGKSLIYVSSALCTGDRTIILTSSRALQDQLEAEFSCIGLLCLKGRSNYVCRALPTLNCETAPCTFGIRCDLLFKGCRYFDTVRRAQQAGICVTNYAYYLRSILAKDKHPFKVDFTVMDEAHTALDHVLQAAAVEITQQELMDAKLRYELPLRGERGFWVQWARGVRGKVDKRANRLQQRVARRGGVTARQAERGRQYKELARKLQIVEDNGTDTGWLLRRTQDGVSLAPVKNLDGLARGLLTNGERRSLLTSATITPYVLDSLVDGGEYREWPSLYPVANRPVVHVRSLYVDRRCTEGDRAYWARRIDDVIARMGDRKGIVHAQSYEWAAEFVQRTRWKDRVFYHRQATVKDVIDAFKCGAPGSVLVSPAVTEGYDFPYDQCEYQVIAKLPFPNGADPVLQERCKLNTELAHSMTAQRLVQACGRAVRAEDDRCITVVIDDHVQWWMQEWGERMTPQWWRESWRSGVVIPKGLEKIRMKEQRL